MRGSGTELTENFDIAYKEKKGKYDIISPHYIVSSAFRYPTCKIYYFSICHQWNSVCNLYKN